ncbi:hypothetical protein FRC01_014020 [Tulasnella sp. 417]|nr:hypothetical protein FRC01_014020 [Tulasnella sp. 417]
MSNSATHSSAPLTEKEEPLALAVDQQQDEDRTTDDNTRDEDHIWGDETRGVGEQDPPAPQGRPADPFGSLPPPLPPVVPAESRK